MLVGESTLTFELVPDWEQLPAGWSHGDVAGVATDSADRVFVFNRSEHPVIIYDRDGRFVGSWGEGVFTRPHGITIRDDVVYCADDTDHTVRALTLDGRLLWTLGTLNQPSDTGYSPAGRANLASIRRGAGPFNRPTRLAVAPGVCSSAEWHGKWTRPIWTADRLRRNGRRRSRFVTFRGTCWFAGAATTPARRVPSPHRTACVWIHVATSTSGR